MNGVQFFRGGVNFDLAAVGGHDALRNVKAQPQIHRRYPDFARYA